VTFRAFLNFGSDDGGAQIGFSCWILVGGRNVHCGVGAGNAAIVTFGAEASKPLVVGGHINRLIYIKTIQAQEVVLS